MVRDFQTVIGNECLVQMPEAIGRQPDYVVAAVGGGSNAMGIFHPYIPHEDVRLIGVEAAGEGLETGVTPPRWRRAPWACCTATAPTSCRTPTARCRKRIRSRPAWTIPASVPSTPGSRTAAAPYVGISDEEALKAFHDCCRIEGIMPALESSHAIAQAVKMAPSLPRDKVILVNLSGRGDKDMHTVAERGGIEL